jgi:hypothetical protein
MDQLAAIPHATLDALASLLLEHGAEPLDGVERLVQCTLREAVETRRLVFANEFERQRFLLVLVDLRVVAVERRSIETIVTLAARVCFALNCRARHVPRLVLTLSMLGECPFSLCCVVPAAHLVASGARQRVAWGDWSLTRDTTNRRGVVAPALARYASAVLASGAILRRPEMA